MAVVLNQKIGSSGSQVIDGYHIRGMLTPSGLQGTVQVTTHDRMDAADRPDAFGLAGHGVSRLTLQIYSDDRSYTMSNIDLDSFEAASDNARRGRRWTFRYAPGGHQPRLLNVAMNHNGTLSPQPGPVGDDLVYGLDSFPQRLLGFRARTSTYDGTVLEFQALRNAKNGLVGAVFGLHDAIARGGGMPSLKLSFAQGNIEINATNLSRLFFEESCGTLLQLRRRPLSDFLQVGAGPELVDPPVDDDAPADVLGRWIDHRYIPPSISYTVERLVVVFNPGDYRTMSFR